jgi:putative membrane protein
MGQSGEVVDAAGKTWQVHDLRETTVTIMLFTVCFSALLATLCLLKQKSTTNKGRDSEKSEELFSKDRELG